MANIAVGDIHGSLIALRTLLQTLDVRDNSLIFLGDYIDRGPDSRQVLETLIELSSSQKHIFLRGNHEEFLLRARTQEGWFTDWVGKGVGGIPTLTSYGASTFDASALSLIPDEHFAFIESTRLFWQTEHEIFVHASLSWQEPEENDLHQLLWRSFHSTVPHPTGKRVICGHTSQRTGLPLDKGYAVCIDTFCYGNGWLTALNLDTNDVVQTNNQGQIRTFPLKQPPLPADDSSSDMV